MSKEGFSRITLGNLNGPKVLARCDVVLEELVTMAKCLKEEKSDLRNELLLAVAIVTLSTRDDFNKEWKESGKLPESVNTALEKFDVAIAEDWFPTVHTSLSFIGGTLKGLTIKSSTNPVKIKKLGVLVASKNGFVIFSRKCRDDLQLKIVRVDYEQWSRDFFKEDNITKKLTEELSRVWCNTLSIWAHSIIAMYYSGLWLSKKAIGERVKMESIDFAECALEVSTETLTGVLEYITRFESPDDFDMEMGSNGFFTRPLSEKVIEAINEVMLTETTERSGDGDA